MRTMHRSRYQPWRSRRLASSKAFFTSVISLQQRLLYHHVRIIGVAAISAESVDFLFGYNILTLTVIPTQLAFLTLCDQAFNPPFLGGKIIELAKFCFSNKRFETKLSFFSKPVIGSHCV